MRHTNYSILREYLIFTQRLIVIGICMLWVIGTKSQSLTPTDYLNGIRYYANHIKKQDILPHIQMLASDSLEGRSFGTIGAIKASDYIASELKKYGLKPIGDRHTFFQPMELQYWKWNNLTFLANNKPLEAGIDYSPRFQDVNGSMKFQASHLLFIGYGIESDQHNDYQYAQAWDEVVVMLDGEPFKQGKSIISDALTPSKWSEDLNLKINLAKRKGAKAVILVLPDDKFPKQNPQSLKNRGFYGDITANNVELPIIRVSESALKNMLEKTSYEQIMRYITLVKTGNISSNYISANVSLHLDVTSQTIRDRNVVGLIPGSDSLLKDEVIILTAHYDHVGINADGEVFNGADDNATGVAALLNIAKVYQTLSKDNLAPKRSIMFLFFTGEEKGLLGSKYYVKNPLWPLNKTKANINIDMIGRRDDKHSEIDNYIYLIGADKINPLLDFFFRHNNSQYIHYKIDYTYNPNDHPLKLYYRSDHYPFVELGIPGAFLFGGFHPDYHKTTDDWPLIDVQKVQDIARLVYYTALDMANYDKPLKTKFAE